MLRGLDFISEEALIEWIRTHLESGARVLSAGYQGKTLLFDENGHKLVIKVPLGNFLTRPVNLALLRHEHRIYQQLDGLPAVPKCYGMAGDQYLVLEFIEGKTIRQDRPDSDSDYYRKLFDAIQQMHQRKVAHFDLKRKENLLVTPQGEPVMIDFGVSILYKGGWHLLNRYLFKLAKQFDLNAWVRHKCGRQYDQLSQDDLQYYKKTFIEHATWKCKRFYKDKILKRFFKRAR